MNCFSTCAYPVKQTKLLGGEEKSIYYIIDVATIMWTSASV